MTSDSRPGFWTRVGPALTLVFLAPLIAEVLPGATRVSALPFALPSELGVWGCGALLIRAAVRHWRLGWLNMLLLAFALALAEECIIQQTSLAPMVLQIFQGPPYARAFGVNWLYLLWALGYESMLIVVVPVMLAELIFPSRRDRPWVGPTGTIVALLYFVLASFTAWYSWTQYVRPKVFHVALYTPPRASTEIALAIILVLILVALGPLRRWIAVAPRPLPPPRPWLLAVIAAVIATLWYGLVLLAFGADPHFPALVAGAAGAAVGLFGFATFPRWAASPSWGDGHRYAVVLGTLFGSMGVSFVGFIGAIPLDLYGKAILDVLALILMIRLGFRLRRSAAARLQDSPSK